MHRALLALLGAGIAVVIVGACTAFSDATDATDANGATDATDATDAATDEVATTDSSADATSPDGASPIDPVALGNLRLWLQAGSLVGLDSGSAVPKWQDTRGAAISASQLTPSAQPTFVASGLGGRPVVRFTSSPATLLVLSPPLDSAPPYTLFVVGTLPSTTNRLIFLGGGWVPDVGLTPDSGFIASGDATYVGFSFASLLFRGGNDQGLTLPDGGAGIAAGSHVLAASVTSGAVGTVWLDGVSLGSGAVSPASFTGIGGRTYYSPPGNETFSDGDVAEILVYGDVLTDLRRRNVEAYLRTKYGLQ